MTEGEKRYEFTAYEPGNYRAHLTAPKVTISKDGRITINSIASDKYLTEYKYAVLLYSEKGNVIGIKPSKEKGSKAYSLGNQVRSKARVIVGRGFLKYFGLDKDETYTYPAEWDEEFEMLVVKLDEGQELITRKKAEAEDDSAPLNLESFVDMTIEATE